MPVVIPFNRCIARPDDEDGGKNLLLVHLYEVAVATACGFEKGSYKERIAFLAGLLHDAAKAHADWQDYILGNREKGPPHAPLGAALFAYCAESLIDTWDLNREERLILRDLALDWSRAVYDHHGTLEDLDEREPPWDEKGARLRHFDEAIDACDMEGIFSFTSPYFPEICLTVDRFKTWLEEFPTQWQKRVRRDRMKCLNRKLKTAAQAAWSIPDAATRLVAADRYHAGGLQETPLERTEAVSGQEVLAKVCKDKGKAAIKDGADPALVGLRREIQQEVVETYQGCSKDLFYTLCLPTGYGKTLSALRTGLAACVSGRCRRILYVAPYLSILSQNTVEISETTGIEVLQHHHLSLAELDDDQVEVTETWQTPILTTTFNQLFRAIFPRRAHQTLRVEALRQAFVIIDEPQIIDLKHWNVFLRLLSVLAEKLDFQVLFTTATLPPLRSGLLHPVVELAPEASPLGRFEILLDEDVLNVKCVAARAVEAVKAERTKSVAVVMNTIRDAAEVYSQICSTSAEGTKIYCLTSLMLPAHKARVIQSIRDDLEGGKRIIAVCTQILEAGVDLSFQMILRALPILPSAAQVAGRANRHNEKDRSRVILFEFRREDGRDSRPYVYRDETSRKQTDRVLKDAGSLKEEELGDALNEYYQLCWDENSNTALMQKSISEASRGKWSALSGIEPFISGPPKISVFVDQPVEKLSAIMQRLQDHFAPEGGQQLLDRYLDWRFRRELSFLDRKRFSALLQQFLVPVPPKIADSIAMPMSEDNFLWKLLNSQDYRLDTGFAHLVSPDEEQHCQII